MVRQLRSSGFTVVEFLVFVAILSIVVAMAVPVFRSAEVSSEVGRFSMILDEAETRAKTLSKASSTVLVIESPEVEALGLSIAEVRNDFEDKLIHPWGGAFRITNAQGDPETHRRGHYLSLSPMSEQTAQAFDRIVDSESHGDGEDWRKSGRLQWRSARKGSVLVFLPKD